MTVRADAGKSIPVDVINNVTGERYSMNLSLALSFSKKAVKINKSCGL